MTGWYGAANNSFTQQELCGSELPHQSHIWHKYVRKVKPIDWDKERLRYISYESEPLIEELETIAITVYCSGVQ
jgi:hypothetical protein